MHSRPRRSLRIRRSPMARCSPRENAKQRVAVSVGLPNRVDTVLQLAELACLLVGAQIDELDLLAHKLRPGKILRDDEQRVLDGVRLGTLVAVLKVGVEEVASYDVVDPALQIVGSAA